MRSRPSGPPAAAVLALALAATACNFGLARQGTPEPTRDPVSYGADLEFSPPPEFGKGKGQLIIYVLEEGTNRPIAGARVRYRGPQRGTMVTNGDGRAAVKVRPGSYSVSLPPCGDRVMITTAAGADVGVVPNGKAGGQLFTTWEHRFVPTGSARASTKPPWKQGEPVTLGVRVEDRCDFSEAGGARLDGTHAWRTSKHFTFLETPSLRAGGDGYIDIRLTCRRSGNGEVVIFDRFDDTQQVDLLLALSAPPPGSTYCA